MLRLNFLKALCYPLTAPRRLFVAWLILPMSLALLVPPILAGLGIIGTVSLSRDQGLGVVLGIAATCLVVGAFPFTLLAGYTLRCRRQVIEGNSVLPSWSPLKQLLDDGGRMDALALFVAVPTLALAWGGVAGVGLTVKNLFGHFSLSTLFLAVLGSGTGVVMLGLALLFWVAAMAFTPMASLRLARGSSVRQALSFRGLRQDIRAGFGDYLLCCVLLWGISVLFSLAQAAFWPLMVISFPVQVYLQLVWAHLLGQYARIYLGE